MLYNSYKIKNLQQHTSLDLPLALLTIQHSFLPDLRPRQQEVPAAETREGGDTDVKGHVLIYQIS